MVDLQKNTKMAKIKRGSKRQLKINLLRAQKDKRWESAFFISEKIMGRKPYSKRGETPFQTKAFEVSKQKIAHLHRNGRVAKSELLFPN
jgi:hypothetical protein